MCDLNKYTTWTNRQSVGIKRGMKKTIEKEEKRSHAKTLTTVFV